MKEYKLEDLSNVKVSLKQLRAMRHALGIDDKFDYNNNPIWKKYKSYRNRYCLAKEEDWVVDLVNQGLFILNYKSQNYYYVVSDKGVAFLEALYKTKIVQYEEDIYRLKELHNER